MNTSFQINDHLKKLRKLKGYTQKQIAEKIHVSDKTISKWECDVNCINSGVVKKYLQALDIEVADFFAGYNNLSHSVSDVCFFLCPVCKSIIYSFDSQHISCCNTDLFPLTAQKSNSSHSIHIEYTDSGYIVSSLHEMDKDHYIKFIACVNSGSVTITKLNPSNFLEISLPVFPSGKIYFLCSKHGLFEYAR